MNKKAIKERLRGQVIILSQMLRAVPPNVDVLTSTPCAVDLLDALDSLISELRFTTRVTDFAAGSNQHRLCDVVTALYSESIAELKDEGAKRVHSGTLRIHVRDKRPHGPHIAGSEDCSELSFKTGAQNSRPGA